MLDYYTCKLAVCTVESIVFRLMKTSLQKKEPGLGNPKYDHTMDRSVLSAEVVKALRSLVNSVLGHFRPLKKDRSNQGPKWM